MVTSIASTCIRASLICTLVSSGRIDPNDHADIPTSTALISERETFYGRPSPSIENLSFISINREHWEAGLLEEQQGLLLIASETRTRDDRPLPDDRTTCLLCPDHRPVESGDAFRFATLRHDPWQRSWPRRFMLHAECVDARTRDRKPAASECEGVAGQTSQQTRQARERTEQ